MQCTTDCIRTIKLIGLILVSIATTLIVFLHFSYDLGGRLGALLVSRSHLASSVFAVIAIILGIVAETVNARAITVYSLLGLAACAGLIQLLVA